MERVLTGHGAIFGLMEAMSAGSTMFMKLGFVSAIVPELSLEQVLDRKSVV